jgi:hypothetical protein
MGIRRVADLACNLRLRYGNIIGKGTFGKDKFASYRYSMAFLEEYFGCEADYR